MGTTILIPTDFKLESLELLKTFIQFQEDEGIEVILAHGIYLSNSISELLFFDESDLKLEMAGRTFLKQLNAVQDELGSKVSSIRVAFYYGFTQSSFEYFTEANRVTKMIIPDNMEFDSSNRKSMDILPFFRKSKITKELFSWDQNNSSFSVKSYQNALS